MTILASALARGMTWTVCLFVFSRVGASCVGRPTCVCAVWAPLRRVNKYTCYDSSTVLYLQIKPEGKYKVAPQPDDGTPQPTYHVITMTRLTDKTYYRWRRSPTTSPTAPTTATPCTPSASPATPSPSVTEAATSIRSQYVCGHLIARGGCHCQRVL